MAGIITTARRRDEDEGYPPPPPRPPTPPSPPAPSQANYWGKTPAEVEEDRNSNSVNIIRALASKYGIPPGEGDPLKLFEKAYGSAQHRGNLHSAVPEFEAQYARRRGTPGTTTATTQTTSTSSPANYNTGFTGAYQGVFNDPLTKQYEQLLQQQLGLYQQQQAAMQQAAQEAAQRRAATTEAVKRLTEYTNQRVQKLQAPAYTGAEQEVMRTQLLDPLERDRQAARQRALETISGRGYELDSGVAQQLLQEVDRAFNEQRTRAQGTLASRQIEEQRSREQEAQQLLQYLAQLPDATARGDIDFVNYLQTLIAQPGQQGLRVGQILADIPTQRLNDALSTLGMSPSISGANTNAIQLLQQLQNQRYMQQQQAAQYWANIGRSFMP